MCRHSPSRIRRISQENSLSSGRTPCASIIARACCAVALGSTTKPVFLSCSSRIRRSSALFATTLFGVTGVAPANVLMMLASAFAISVETTTLLYHALTDPWITASDITDKPQQPRPISRTGLSVACANANEPTRLPSSCLCLPPARWTATLPRPAASLPRSWCAAGRRPGSLPSA